MKNTRATINIVAIIVTIATILLSLVVVSLQEQQHVQAS